MKIKDNKKYSNILFNEGWPPWALQPPEDTEGRIRRIRGGLGWEEVEYVGPRPLGPHYTVFSEIQFLKNEAGGHCPQGRACKFLNSGFSKGPSHQTRMTWKWYCEMVLFRPSAEKSLFNVLLEFSDDTKINQINKSFGPCFKWGSKTFIWTTRAVDMCLLPNALL